MSFLCDFLLGLFYIYEQKPEFIPVVKDGGRGGGGEVGYIWFAVFLYTYMCAHTCCWMRVACRTGVEDLVGAYINGVRSRFSDHPL